jgi:hypothetical protein
MANNPVVNTLTFTGNVAGQATIQAQGIAGGLTFLLPNTTPIQGQLLDVQSINGANVFLGWVSPQSTSITLSQIQASGATTGQTIIFNGTNWVPSTGLPGEGTVTSVAVAVPAWLAVSGSPITSAGTITISSAPALTANWVLATPNGSSGVLAPRALVAADIPALPYDASGAAAAVAAQLASTKAAVTHQFLNSYTAGTPGVFTSAQPAFTDISGTVTIAQINSTKGNGGFVQLTTSGSVAGDVVTYDANGNVIDSGTLLSSLALASNVVTSFAGRQGVVVGATSDYAAVTGGVQIAANGNSRGVLVNTATSGANHIWLWSPAGSALVDVYDGNVAITGTLTLNSVVISTTAPSAGQVLTASSPTAAAWANDNDLQSFDGAGNPVVLQSDNHLASGAATLTTGSVTITLTGNSVYSAAGVYSVQVTRTNTPGGAANGILWVTNTDGSHFVIHSTDATDSTSTVAWTAIGF